jgi:hypothetical protein
MKPRCNVVSEHPSLFTCVRWPKAKAPKRREVLDLAESVIPWDRLEALVRPFYQADVQHTGRRGYALRMMLRCFVLQTFWRMSDRQTEAAILDSHAMCAFIGSDPWAPRPPSASALLAFRALLEQSFDPTLGELAGALRLLIHDAMHAAGLAFRCGEIREPVFRRIGTTPARGSSSEAD